MDNTNTRKKITVSNAVFKRLRSSKARNFRKDAIHIPKKVCQKSQIWRTPTETIGGRQADDNPQIHVRISDNGAHRT